MTGSRGDYTEEQKEFRKKLNCPQCGSYKTRFSVRRGRMMCEKCGHQWEKQVK